MSTQEEEVTEEKKPESTDTDTEEGEKYDGGEIPRVDPPKN